MAQQYGEISDRLAEFIAAQHVFFVATAAREGRVNVSPKGLDGLRVLGPNRVVWLNGTGSGNETAAHLLDVNRMTLMFCSFERQPLILRLYGTATEIQPDQPEWDECIGTGRTGWGKDSPASWATVLGRGGGATAGRVAA